MCISSVIIVIMLTTLTNPAWKLVGVLFLSLHFCQLHMIVRLFTVHQETSMWLQVLSLSFVHGKFS
jgi:hypothetical protein